MNKIIKGPFAVLMTPFIGEKIDKESFIKQIKRVNGTGVSGFVVNGSTAEFIQLSIDEQKEMTELVAKYKDADKKIIVSACTGNAVDTVNIAKHAKKVGADAILVCPPYYFKFTPKEREEYFIKVADNSPVPVILYNIPFFSQELELDIIYRLFKHENIIGIKDSSANMKRIMHMLSIADEDISIMTGTDDILITALFAGCAGSMTALAAIYPDKIAQIYRCFENGQIEDGWKIQREIMPDLRKADSKTFPFGYKELMEKVSGIPMGNKE
ncbi:MAG: dihydrodipicolinate synthase family protein [Clostridia bacterium]|nr:dihydrodipicolinate synthase family protein [Clostridia bacterium]